MLDVFRGRLLLRLGNKYLSDMGQRVFEASVSVSVQLSAPLVQPMRQMKTIRDFVASPSGLCVLFDAATMPLFLAAVYLMHPGLGHAMLGGLLLLVLLAWWTEKATGVSIRSSNSSGQAAQLRLDGALRNAPTVVAMGMRTSMFNHWQSANQELLASTSQASDRAGLHDQVGTLVHQRVDDSTGGVVRGSRPNDHGCDDCRQFVVDAWLGPVGEPDICLEG